MAFFIWDKKKEEHNKQIHRLDFVEAARAFFDPNCIIAVDEDHSQYEERFYCIGKVNNKCITVRFTYREDQIRIIGAGYWRKGRKLYEKENKKI